MTSSSEPSVQVTRAKILVVDDLPENLRLLQDILVQQGYDVRFANSGKLALLSLSRFQPDLILLDIMMPDLDGFTVCQQLKANRETENIPVIFMSALDDGSNKVKGFQVGGNDYITKPFITEEVLARIRYQISLQTLQRQLQHKNQELIQQNEQLQQAQHETQFLLQAIWAIEKSQTLEEAISSILDVICQNICWDYGEGWLPNPDKGVLEYIPQFQSCSAAFERFQKQSRLITFASGEGLPGRIWQSHKPEWIEDCSTCSEPVYLRTQLVVDAGLKAVFGVPVVESEKLLAILVFYHTQAIPYQSRIVELIQAVATQLSSSLQQAQLKQKLQRANQELELLANLDGLTQIANRRHFDYHLQQEWQRMQRLQLPLSLILCDVDYFKRYNDCYGHLAGDDCLIQVAQTLYQSMQRAADIVARYGGEEFAIILPYTDTPGAIAVAERIRTCILELQIPHADSQISPIVTISLGVSSLIPTSSCSPQCLIQLADEALYQAKQSGRNTYAVTPAISVQQTHFRE
ncbi:diguanylate cyclase domain-containing protein [Lyngbya sp. PCC 8106]|uniref:diguanylate cyclase domain-containing protein n=1 Tax=Lyngbya sp. (strain PCC 8106) TaxID=313612 RepID=UPI0000EAA329|nr:diguanylate cyclase [Lyngbya sp. PCC 8106]EAW36973.1 Putative diguanylate cyclase (GGDEF domain) [Lyngbya sp. PCC 8106]